MALIIEIKVVPQSGKSEWVLEKSGTLKCFLKSPPEKGAANKELIKMLADALGFTQNDIEIISGLTTRKKRIKIHKALTKDQVLSILGLGNQQSLL